ncbi:MAG: hypothetical protein ACRDZO_22445 [Egibacteraceae bacterium]
MDADRFWRRTGVVAGLDRYGLRVLIVDRPSRPASWTDEAEALAAALGAWRALPIVAGSNAVDRLLTGQALRGILDTEFAGLSIPVFVMPSEPENPIHARATVKRILALARDGRELPGFPEPLHPDFPARREAFLVVLAEVLR